MNCPHCNQSLEKMYVLAPATVWILQTVGAELTPEDLTEENVAHDYRGNRSVRKFALDEQLDTLDNNLMHSELEIDDERASFSCQDCLGEIDRETADAWIVDGRVWAKDDPAVREPF